MDQKKNHDDRLPASGTTRRSGSSNEQRHSGGGHEQGYGNHRDGPSTANRSAVASEVPATRPSNVTSHHQGEDASFASSMSDTAGVSSAGPHTSHNSHRNLHDVGEDRASVPRRSEDAGARPPPPSLEEVASNLQNDANSQSMFASVASDTTLSAARMSDNATGHVGGGVAAAAHGGMTSALASAAGDDIENESRSSHFLARRLQHQDKFMRASIDRVDEEEAASSPRQETTLARSSLGTQVQTVSPGAFAVAGPGGPSAVATSQDDFSFSLQHHGENVPDTSDPVITAELVDSDDRSTIRREIINELQHDRHTIRREIIDELQHAELAPVVSDLPNEGNPAQSRKCQVFLAAFSLAAIVAIVLGITLSRNNNGPDATPPPTPEPTISQQELKEWIALVSFDGGAALEESSSPQSQALMWLYNDTLREDYPDWRKIQRYALATLYHSTNGAGWTNDFGWLTDSDECSWWYDSSWCDPCQTGQAVMSHVCLYNNGLTGSIPPELALLSNSLDYLHLSINDIGGSIPSELGLLSNLEQMYLHNNKINGNIPSQVGMLSKLTSFSLRDNALTGLIPMAINSMTNLNGLELSNNNFTGEFECPSFIEYCVISCFDPCCTPNPGSLCRSL